MKSVVPASILGIALAGGLSMSAVFAAEEATKPLPTLLIKGEVVSLDANDPSATLLKVKDRYGFETPIFLAQETKITQGDAVIPSAKLTPGTAVEVEYNFDVNTAKRHAVTVKLPIPPTPAGAASVPSAAPAATVAVPAPAVPPAVPAALPLQAKEPTAPAASTASSPTQEQKPVVQ